MKPAYYEYIHKRTGVASVGVLAPQWRLDAAQFDVAPLYKAQVYTGGDERTHMVCLCPDCTSRTLMVPASYLDAARAMLKEAKDNLVHPFDSIPATCPICALELRIDALLTNDTFAQGEMRPDQMPAPDVAALQARIAELEQHAKTMTEALAMTISPFVYQRAVSSIQNLEQENASMRRALGWN